MINFKQFEPLTQTQMDSIIGGWKFWGWDYIYADQTMATTGGGMDATGGYGDRYVMGIKVDTGFHHTDDLPGTGINRQ